ncbi:MULTISPECIES: UdgX family uracil-DNA binding protein [Ramlibacter]|uniref:UdgX family uracil-DNA binding protein n=1 Tax=Ramlibacter TaxID=174951 RepID=UPI00257C457D|nr:MULTISPECIES: UdgX family uracil-DNA binding protein [Ramlibacter]
MDTRHPVPAQAPREVRAQLAGETDLDGFRALARSLWARGTPPGQVRWHTGEARDLFEPGELLRPGDALPTGTPAPRVPAAFGALCESVVLHRDPSRFALLYTLLWRLQHEPGLRHDPLDADMLRAQGMAREVRREMHKMRAFVRFRPVADTAAPGGARHVAWFEPAHHVVQANAPWFSRRFANMHWAILTPECCVAWDGETLHFEPGADPSRAPTADAGEQLWLTYYQSIFNPARLNPAQMRKEMPVRYWAHLPEARLVAPLESAAAACSAAMIAREPQPGRRLGRATAALARHEVTGGLQACDRCPWAAQATQAVDGEGPLQARLMLVGEQPGDEEDLAGRPFVGPAGRLLDTLLAEAGLDRAALRLTNAVRHFKFELRGRRRIHKTPSQADALACAGWLDDEIAQVRPAAVVALGATAWRALLPQAPALTQARGRWWRREDGLAVMPTFHPAALLRMPPDQAAAARAQVVADLARAAAGPGLSGDRQHTG